MADVSRDFSKSLTKEQRPIVLALIVLAVCAVLIGGLLKYADDAAGRAGAVVAKVDLVLHDVASANEAERRLFAAGDPTQTGALSDALDTVQHSVEGLVSAISGDSNLSNKADAVKSASESWLDQMRSSEVNWSTHSAVTEQAGLMDTLVRNLDGIAETARDSSAVAQTISAGGATVLIVVAIIVVVLGISKMTATAVVVTAEIHKLLEARDGQIEILRRNRALLLATMQGIGDALMAVDMQGRITFMNPLAEKLTGWIEQDAVGKDITRVLTLANEKTKDKQELPIQEVLNNHIDKELAANSLVVGRADTGTKPISGHVAPVWDDAGDVIGAAVLFRDVSERRGAREAIRTSEAHKEAIIDNALDAVILMTSDGKIIEFNASAESIFGYKRADALGRMVADLIVPPSLREKHNQGLRNYLTSRKPRILGKRVEMTGMRKGGVEFPMELSITVVPELEPPVFATFLRDITESKAAEAVLVSAKETAEAESRDKSQFLNNMSDELRTPLNAVIGYSEMLQEEVKERRPEDFLPDLKKINEAGRHLLMLVNDVLDLSRIEAGKMQLFLDTFEVADLIEDVTRAAQPVSARNSNRLNVLCDKGLGSMMSDRNKIRQSILYLVNNATKFATDRDLELRVARKGSNVYFKMSDLSPGIAEEASDKLAEAFASASRTSTLRFGGHGLGLEIARQLCEMMGGSLTGDREVGHSPTFTICLPDKITGPAS
ncbi:MAG: PAS domain-containing sensor histidine kinase [Capsulimonadaceae bacterium]